MKSHLPAHSRTPVFLLALWCFLAGCQPQITPKPIADFDMEPVAGSPGKVKFINKSTDADRFQWSFGDGQASTESAPTVDYRTNGIFTVSLIAKNKAGEDQSSKSIEVNGVERQVIADFDFAPVAGEPGVVRFTNKSKNADRYQWEFGDGQASTEANPTVKYGTNGNFLVKLIAKSGTGSDEVSKSMTVNGVAVTGSILFWTNGKGDGSDIEIYIDNFLQGAVTAASATAPGCGTDGSVTYSRPEGTYSFYAKSKSRSWSGVVTIKNGECRPKLLPQ